MTQNSLDMVPEANFGNPTPPAPALPQEVRKTIEDVLEAEYGRASSPVVTQSIFKALAPHWPRPAAVTADARALAERVMQVARTIPLAPATHESAVAAVLAPVVARVAATAQRLKEAEAEVAALKDSFPLRYKRELIIECNNLQARAEAAERELEEMTGWRNECGFRYNQAKAERDQHASELAQARAEIVRLEKNLYTGDDDEKRDLRAALASAKQEVERLKGVAINGAGAQAFKDLRADIDRLNAEVAVLEGQLAAAEKQLAAAQEELTTYRHAECAIVQQRLFGRFLEGGSPTPLLDSIKRMLDAARREGGAT